MEILGYSLAILIGLSLGLMGGGGSILTVPIFVYVLGQDPKVAIAASLAVVGLTSLVGSITHFRAGNVNVKIALIFGSVAMAGTYVGARLSAFMSGQVQLIIFAVVMALAAFFMFRNASRTKNQSPESESTEVTNQNLPYHWIALEGLGVGVLTGIVGVGGGFMIVPALVLLAKVPMKQAVGTSLLIIALKSAAGFAGYVGQVPIDWTFIGSFAVLASLGILVGTKLIKYISPQQLKKGFAVFLVIMSVLILYKNI